MFDWFRQGLESLKRIEGKVDKLMATAASILAQIAQEQTDLATLTSLITNLIAAFNAAQTGSITPAQAAQISAALTADDATVASMNSAISAVLPTASTPVPPAPSAVAAAVNTIKQS